MLFVDLGANFGGVESYLVSLAKLLHQDLDIYALCVLPELERRLATQNVKTVRLPVFAGPWKPLRFVAAMLALPVVLWKHRIDAIQLNGFLESVLIFPARLLGRKAIYTRHGPFELEQYQLLRHPHKVLPRALARTSVRYASHVVCVSGAVEGSVQNLLPKSRYSVISNWVGGQERFRPLRRDLSKGARILCVSRLERYKGVHLLIEACRTIGHPLEVVIAGDGAYRAELEQMAAADDRVKFVGFQASMEPFYEQADIFVMSSLGPEGLPMTSLEGMAHGLPCVFSDLPVHAEITDGGQGAYLFASGSVEELRSAIVNLLDSYELREHYARKGYNIVESRYTESSVKGAYIDVFSKETAHG